MSGLRSPRTVGPSSSGGGGGGGGHLSEQDDPVNPRDVVDDRLALADRFGLSLGFHNCTQDDYLAIVAGYSTHFGLAW